MNFEKDDTKAVQPAPEIGKREVAPALEINIAQSIDILVDYLVDNRIDGIHSLIIGEVEKRLILKVLERTKGNKGLAAKRLGMSRNTFYRKVQKLSSDDEGAPDGKK